MTTDFRALCVELTDCLEKANWPLRHRYVFRQWIDIARAALADEPAVPTVMEIVELSSEIEAAGLGQVDFARAVLARWGKPTPVPPADEELTRLWFETDGRAVLGAKEYARAVLARWGNAAPQLSDEEIIAFWSDHCAGDGDAGIIRLARWGSPVPAPAADGEVAELVADQPAFASWLAREMPPGTIIGDPYWWAPRIARHAAELLQRQVMVPVSVSDALIKAECALSDIAEGEPMTDEGDPLQWAERRCADTLAIIRPTMRQHKIRTSEWPPLPLPEAK